MYPQKQPHTPARVPTPVRVMPYSTEDGEGRGGRTAGAQDGKGDEKEEQEGGERKAGGLDGGDGR